MKYFLSIFLMIGMSNVFAQSEYDFTMSESQSLIEIMQEIGVEEVNNTLSIKRVKCQITVCYVFIKDNVWANNYPLSANVNNPQNRALYFKFISEVLDETKAIITYLGPFNSSDFAVYTIKDLSCNLLTNSCKFIGK